jgi:hypothetical protein
MASTIRNDTARRIAGDWHGGQVSALYSLCSTGRLTDADLPRAVRELEREIDYQQAYADTPDDADLRSLLRYLEADARTRGIEV